jgi:hypothetical protein
MSLSAKDPSEIITLTFDFAALAASVANPVLTVTRLSGTADPTPQAILSGAAQVSGAQVLQQIVGGVAGTHYHLRCQVDTPDGSRYVLAADLPVRGA